MNDPLLLQVAHTAPPNWDAHIAGLPGAHVLQTTAWASVKAQYGWQPLYLTWAAGSNAPPQAAALVLQRSLPVAGLAARMRILYAAKGPLLDWGNPALRGRVLDDLRLLARRQGGIFIKIDPDVPLGSGIPGTDADQPGPHGLQTLNDLQGRGWIFSAEQIQFRNTVLLDLTHDEEALLAHMKQKTRYNIRLAMRKGLTVRVGTPADFPLLYRMYAQTSLRDGFVIRDEAYYRLVWQTFYPQPAMPPAPSQPIAEPLIAEIDGEPIAALVLFRFAGKAWYLYGMSTEAHRETMPNYLLQWEALRRARAAGCTVYDLWGAPDEFSPSDSLWGVFRFKEGLGGRVVRHIGAWDLPAQPLLYRLYTQTLPRLLDVMRRRGRQRTRQATL